MTLSLVLTSLSVSVFRCGLGCGPRPCAGHAAHNSDSHTGVCLALEKQVSARPVHPTGPGGDVSKCETELDIEDEPS